MCEPVTIAMMVISVASAAMQQKGKHDAAKAQFALNATQREQQSEEIHAASSIKAGERVQQSRAEQARLRVAGGEAGVLGQSFEAMLMDTVMQEDMDLGIIGLDAKFAQRASETRFLSANASVDNPSGMETGMALVGAAAQGYSMGQSLSIPTSSFSAITSDADQGTALADIMNSGGPSTAGLS